MSRHYWKPFVVPKRAVVEQFSHVRTSGLFILMFPSFDNLVDDVSRFEGISVLDPLPYERFNVNVKRAYG